MIMAPELRIPFLVQPRNRWHAFSTYARRFEPRLAALPLCGKGADIPDRLWRCSERHQEAGPSLRLLGLDARARTHQQCSRRAAGGSRLHQQCRGKPERPARRQSSEGEPREGGSRPETQQLPRKLAYSAAFVEPEFENALALRSGPQSSSSELCLRYC